MEGLPGVGGAEERKSAGKKQVKVEGGLEALSSEEEDSKDPEMEEEEEATMSWGELGQDSQLDGTQSHVQEDEETMQEIAKEMVGEEVDAVLAIVAGRR